ncbi:MAG: LysR substrate-binding domain-containing protein [Woeseiaceae bacterium]|nr:LysR substrate-binding domain-containing protein [Woeseiaceae bacterium]
MRYPTTKQLRYFVALSEHKHFGKAAEASFVSQSAFSAAIAELESILDAQLVDRTNRQVTITSIGQQVAVQARLCLMDIESLVELAGEQRKPLTGDLRLGVIPTIAPFMLPRVLPNLREAYPKLDLYLIEDQTDRIHERLLDGEVDVLLLALPYDLRSVETLNLFRDHFLLACREGTDRVDPHAFRMSRLEMDSVLLLEDGHCLREHALAACKLKDERKIRPFSATSLLTLIEMVDADMGVTFLPEMATDSALLRHTRVAMYRMSERSYRTIGLAWRRGSNRRAEFEELGEFIRKQA